MTNQDNIGEGHPTLTSVKGRNLRVFVVNQRNKPLMPATSKKARDLLKLGKAKVVSRTPFVIQLLYSTGETKQPISLGVDAGTKHIGLSATTPKEVLYEAEVILRTDIQELLSTRKAFRSHRRSRKTRYRQARFLNRKNRVGKLPPSVQNKVDVHLKVIRNVHKILPITKVVVEVAQFDIQKINNPSIRGKEYQEGPQKDFWNNREYVLFRDGHKCQYCSGKSKDKILNVHHIETRKTGGDSPNNLTTLCETCHNTIHRDKLTKSFKRGKSFKDATQMNGMRMFILNALKEVYSDVEMTYGYITKFNRINNDLYKSHVVDARCISKNPLAKSNDYFLIKQVRGQNRQLHKATFLKGGIRKNNKAPKYVFGFQLFDKVQYKGQDCFIFGRRTRGSFDIRLLDGTKINVSVIYKKLRLLEKASSFLTQKGEGASSPA